MSSSPSPVKIDSTPKDVTLPLPLPDKPPFKVVSSVTTTNVEVPTTQT